MTPERDLCGDVCGVCGDRPHGLHFGIACCRACAAFFRRSTIGGRRYQCRFNGKCEIGRDLRCCCRACRLKRCEELGMKVDGWSTFHSRQFLAVQRNRDRIGPRKKQSYQSDLDGSSPAQCEDASPDEGPFARKPTLETAVNEDASKYTFYAEPSPTAQPANSLDEALRSAPLLSEMFKGYRKYIDLQRANSNLDGVVHSNKLIDENIGNYLDDINAIRTSLSFVSDMINNHFRPLEKFNTSVRWTLLRQFFCQFIIAERSFLSSRYFPDPNSVCFMFDCTHYGSLDALDRWFAVENCKVEPHRMAEIFRPTMTRINAMITSPMRKLRISDAEFVGLMGLLFWNDTLSNLALEETQVIVETQQRIVDELYSICRVVAGPSPIDISSRFGILCNCIPLINRFSNEMAGNFSLVHMNNAFDVDQFVHLFIPQTF